MDSVIDEKTVATIKWFFGGDKFGTKEDGQTAEKYSTYIKGGGRVEYADNFCCYQPVAVVSRTINGKMIHLSAWKDMQLLEGDIIHSVSLGVAVESLIGGIFRIKPDSGKCVVDANGFLIFAPVKGNFLAEAWKKYAKDKSPKRAGFPKVGIKG